MLRQFRDYVCSSGPENVVPYEASDVHSCRHRRAGSRPDSLLLATDEARQHEIGRATR